MFQFNAIRRVFHQWDRASIFPGVTSCFDLDQTPGHPRENVVDSEGKEASRQGAYARRTGWETESMVMLTSRRPACSSALKRLRDWWAAQIRHNQPTSAYLVPSAPIFGRASGGRTPD